MLIANIPNTYFQSMPAHSDFLHLPCILPMSVRSNKISQFFLNYADYKVAVKPASNIASSDSFHCCIARSRRTLGEWHASVFYSRPLPEKNFGTLTKS